MICVDLYALQPLPPSNVNRDDTGSPKTAFYGGVQRARVSSQAWKRAMRTMFGELLPAESLGVRTKLAVAQIAERIVEKRPELAERAEELAAAVLQMTGVKVKASLRKGSDEGASATDYLIFIARSELDGLAELVLGWLDEGVDVSKPSAEMKKEVSGVFHGAQAVDIALFGRMLADAPDLNTDASAQVAHAISVDRVTQEYDYFTAVDDCAADDNAGAGMIGTVPFNSSTLYRYATVNLGSLLEQLGDITAASEAVAAFAKAFACSMPTGKQNTFANRTLPTTFVVSFRDKQPINPVTAFEAPVYPREGESISSQARKLFAEELRNIEQSFDMSSVASWCVLVNGDDSDSDVFGEVVDLASLLEHVREEVGILLSSEEGR